MSSRFALLAGALVVVAAGAVAAVPAGASNDPLFPQQWALAQIHATEAWARSTGTGVTIGVVDTGVDLPHEDLGGKVASSVNCVGSKGDEAACHGNGQDDNGHGTHVSGIAAAATGNGRGIAGVAPGARLVVAKALGSDGSGSVADVVAGIHWVVHHGARVVNLSLSDAIPVAALQDPSFSEAVEWAWTNGAVPVLAAGNNTVASSASYGSLHAIVVAATGPNGSTPYYSSSVGDARWGIAAPGGNGGPLGGDTTTDVLSTYWAQGKANAYATEAGTSMAAPHVAGVVALVLAQGVAPGVAVDRVLAGADRFSCGPNCRGRLNAAAAVGAAGSPATSIPAGSSSRTPSAAVGSSSQTSPSPSPSPSPSTNLPQMPSATTSTTVGATAANDSPGAALGNQAVSPAVSSRHIAASPSGSPVERGHRRAPTAVIAAILIGGIALALAEVRRRALRRR